MTNQAIQIPVVILAGGLGTRLRAVVSDVPKPLAPVAGEPFILRLIDQAVVAGASEVILCVGYLAERVEEYVSRHEFGIPVRLSIEESPLGTGGAALRALSLFPDSTFVLMNGDSFINIDLRAIRDAHVQRNAVATIAVSGREDTSRYGSAAMDTNQAITAFREKSPSAGAGYINAGVYVIERSMFANVPPGVPVSLERDVFPTFVHTALYAFPHAGAFIDIGTPSDFERAQTFF